MENNIKIACYIDRASMMKVFAPVVVEAIKNNIDVYVLCGPNPETSWKQLPSIRPLKENIDIPDNDKVNYAPFGSKEEFIELLVKYDIAHLFTISGASDFYTYVLAEAKKQGIKIHELQFVCTHLNYGPEQLKYTDTFFVYSQAAVKIHYKKYPSFNAINPDTKFVVVGNPLLDAVHLLDSSDVIKKRFKLPLDKKVVLLMSTNLANSFWSKYVFGATSRAQAYFNTLSKGKLDHLGAIKKQAATYKEIMNTLVSWCERNNAVLVVKTRDKHTEPKYVQNSTSFFVSDDNTWYPARSVELISIADLVIGFNSSSVLESAALGKPNISVRIINQYHRSADVELYIQAGAYGHPGVSVFCEPEDFKSFLERQTFASLRVDRVEQDKYVKKHLGWNDGQAAKRIIEYIT